MWRSPDSEETSLLRLISTAVSKFRRSNLKKILLMSETETEKMLKKSIE
jgi:hypothetical protein